MGATTPGYRAKVSMMLSVLDFTSLEERAALQRDHRTTHMANCNLWLTGNGYRSVGNMLR